IYPPSNTLSHLKNITAVPGQDTYAHNFNLANNTRDLRVSVVAQLPTKTIVGYQYVDCSHLQPPPPTEFPIMMEGVVCPRSECWLQDTDENWTARFTVVSAATGTV